MKNPFNKKEDKAPKKKVTKVTEESVEAKKEDKKEEKTVDTLGNVQVGYASVLRGFYISEKSGLAANFNQYVFRVIPKANKTQVKREVAKIFNVKVKDVKMLNMPAKRRDIGRYPGFKSGFKKAMVVLEKGYAINQAKA